MEQQSPTMSMPTPPAISIKNENFSSTAKQVSTKSTDQTASETNPAIATVISPIMQEEVTHAEANNPRGCGKFKRPR